MGRLRQSGRYRNDVDCRRGSDPPPVWPVRLAAVLVAALVGGASYAGWTWLPTSAERPERAAGSEPAVRPTPTRTFQAIVGGTGEGLHMARLATLPKVLVLDFPSLAAQGRALNRVAALTEKAGLSRKHVVSAEELARFIKSQGESAATFYHGHNYDSGELAAFYETAKQDGVTLNKAERRLRRWLEAAGAIRRTESGGFATGPTIDYVVSIARMTGKAADLRRDILRHEIGHAVFDQQPAYRNYAERFVTRHMSPEVRAAFTRFLAKRNYDTTDQQLVVDEVQAYLHFTPNSRIIDDTALGLPEGTLADVRAKFRRRMRGRANPPSKITGDRYPYRPSVP